MTSADQVRKNGFAIIPEVLPRDAIDRLQRELAGSELPRSHAGARHLMRHPSVAKIASSDRFLSIAREVIGENARPYRATLFYKSAEANWLVAWHQDTALPLKQRVETAGWGPWSIKAGMVYAHAPAAALEQVVALRLHLDDSSGDNGPLRVLPASHLLGVLNDEAIESLVRRMEPADCLVGSGGVVVMRPLILHASSKAVSERPRRVMHIEYAAGFEFEGGLELAIA